MQRTKGKAAPPKAKRINAEHDVQSAVFEWVREIGRAIFPELESYYSLTSGQPRWGGQLNYYKDEGLETGYPDTHLAISRGGYISLWIEFKAPGRKSTLRNDQRARIVQLSLNGHLVFVLDSVEDAITVLEEYSLGYYVRAPKPDWLPVYAALP